MRFYCIEWKERVPKNLDYPCVILEKNSWNDYGFNTTFEFYYYDESGAQIIANKGNIKILQRNRETTDLPKSFDHLNSNFCSLGQSLEYYSAISTLDPDTYKDILKSLRDVVYFPSKRKEFETWPGFTKSLLRFSEAEKAFNEAASLFLELNKKAKGRTLKFQFRCRVQGADNDHIIDFDFSRNDAEIFRLTAIIGRNGTGKTQVLANFARSMSGLKGNSQEFFPVRPSFSKVISISYSAFDQFSRPSDEIKDMFSDNSSDFHEQNISPIQHKQRNEQYERIKQKSELFSYVYCGMRGEKNNFLTPEEIRLKLKRAFQQVIQLDRESDWREILKTLLDNQLNDDSDENFHSARGEITDNFYSQLSSGQRILVLVLTEVIANIEPESIILFDEPELHLHPEAISALARAMQKLLSRFNSYGIIATHSPILLQEIPSACVRIFHRQGTYVIVDRLEIESFGENLTLIIDEVFESSGLHNNYKDYFRLLLQKYSHEEILAIFNNRLGFNARAALSAIEKTLE